MCVRACRAAALRCCRQPGAHAPLPPHASLHGRAAAAAAPRRQDPTPRAIAAAAVASEAPSGEVPPTAAAEGLFDFACPICNQTHFSLDAQPRGCVATHAVHAVHAVHACREHRRTRHAGMELWHGGRCLCTSLRACPTGVPLHGPCMAGCA